MLQKNLEGIKKVLSPQLLGVGLVIIALPLTLTLALTTQNLNQYASTYQSPLLNTAIQKQQAMIADQTQFLAELDQSISQADASNSADTSTCGLQITPALKAKGASPDLITASTWTAADDAVEATDIQTEQTVLAKASVINVSSSDNSAVQLQKGAEKLSLILEAVKTKTRRQKRHCKHHKKIKGTPAPTKTPKPTKSPTGNITPTETVTPTTAVTDTPTPTP